MRLLRIATAAVVATVIAAYVVDGATLFIWRFRVERYTDELRESAAHLRSGKAGPHAAARMAWSGDQNSWAVPLLEVENGGPRPSVITVDGNGGLNFMYLPPLLAWTRHVPWAYNRHPIQGSDTYPYNDVYTLRISTLEGRPRGKVLPSPTVELEHGLPF